MSETPTKKTTTKTLPKETSSDGPNKYSRNQYGLLNGVEYIFTEDGSVDWRAMIPNEYIVVNQDRFKGESVPNDVSKLDDRDLLILLGGIKEVAKLRGLIRRKTRIVESGPQRAVAECDIVFLPNYESNGELYEYSDAASATTDNTNGFGQQFLETIAANRAFVRAVRNALRIDIVGSDEVNASTGGHTEVETVKGSGKPWKVLEEKAALRNVKSIDKLKEVLIEKQVKGFDLNDVRGWNSWEDIPNNYVWKLMSMLNKKGS